MNSHPSLGFNGSRIHLCAYGIIETSRLLTDKNLTGILPDLDKHVVAFSRNKWILHAWLQTLRLLKPKQCNDFVCNLYLLVATGAVLANPMNRVQRCFFKLKQCKEFMCGHFKLLSAAAASFSTKVNAFTSILISHTKLALNAFAIIICVSIIMI